MLPENKNATIYGPGAAGPLVVSEANPRYFTVAADDVADRRAVYLTGSHVNNNFHDGFGSRAPTAPRRRSRYDYHAYLEFLEEHGHNFIRLWRWEQFKSQAAGGSFHLCMTPQPWPRTGPGDAKDGKPKFDLVAVRPRRTSTGCATASSPPATRASTSSVMLFDGLGLHLSPPPDNVEGHPFHAANNVNGIGDHLDRRLPGAAARPARPGAPGGVHPQGRRHRPRPAERALRGRQRVVGRRIRRREELPEALGMSSRPTGATPPQWQYWVIDIVKQLRAQTGLRPAPDRDDDAVPGRGPDARSTTRCSTARRTGSRPATTTRFRRRASDGADSRRRAGSTTRPRTTAARSSSPTPTTTRRARATRCGPGSRSCAATTRSSWTSGSSTA